jgi:hypothetical protein
MKDSKSGALQLVKEVSRKHIQAIKEENDTAMQEQVLYCVVLYCVVFLSVVLWCSVVQCSVV